LLFRLFLGLARQRRQRARLEVGHGEVGEDLRVLVKEA
jgi:hypothetical protein